MQPFDYSTSFALQLNELNELNGLITHCTPV